MQERKLLQTLMLQVRVRGEDKVYYIRDKWTNYRDEVDIIRYEAEKRKKKRQTNSRAKPPGNASNEIIKNNLMQFHFAAPFVWLQLFGHY